MINYALRLQFHNLMMGHPDCLYADIHLKLLNHNRPTLMNYIYFCNAIVDSEKSLSPPVDETQPFPVVPFRPYAWNSYSGSDIRHLVQQSLHHQHHHPMDLKRSPELGYYSDRAIEPTLFNRSPVAENDSDYRSAAGLFERAAAPGIGLYSERNLYGKSPEIKAVSDLPCSRFILNGTYKCIKCSKVR